jgi:hypothetical protein
MTAELKPCPLCGKQPRLGDANFYCNHYATKWELWATVVPDQATLVTLDEEMARKRWNDRGDDGPIPGTAEYDAHNRRAK